MSSIFLLQPKKVLILFLQLVSTALLCLLFSFATEKSYVLTGKVVDEKDNPIPFASIHIKATKNGVQADADGKYSLAVTTLPATIIVASIGYETIEKRITEADFKDGKSDMAIRLNTMDSHLDEVVVVGYATERKAMYTTSSSVASAKPGGKVAGVTASSPRHTKVKKPALTSDKEVRHEDEKVATTGIKEAGKRSSLLTAGEVNDFKKWKMWEDYNNSDFESYSKTWNMYATQRYSVQLQNENLSALTGEKVYLINKQNGDTIWTAVSDNTGKAELWKGFSGKKEENDLVIKVETSSATYPAIVFSQGINRIVVKKDCAVSNKVEIAFVVDATGSMQDEIDFLKEELEDVLGKVTKKDPSIDMYSGAVFYRDKGDEYVTVAAEMRKGISDAISFIKKQNAAGGGDYPEALNAGLNDAIHKLAWSREARTRIIFLLMDAPPHDNAREEMSSLIGKAAAMGIRIVPVACSGTDKATEFIMRSMALATNGTYLFLTDDSGIGNTHIKPTTDEFKVETLNDLLQRTIEQMCFVNSCAANSNGTEPIGPFKNIETVKVFPNPTKGLVTLRTSKKIKEIFLADFAGKIIMRKVVNNEKENYNIDLSGFPSATYFIRYVTDDNKSGAEKVILVR